MRSMDSIYKKDHGVYLIEIRLNNLDQFFNNLDPSPFHDKDIDDDAEKYIFDSVRAFPLKIPLKLVFYLPLEHHLKASKILPYAIENYFDFRTKMATNDLISTLYEGRIALLLGTLFLIICIGTRAALGFIADKPFGSILLEGLSIIGWVAMWRPIQIFLYDWWSLYRKRRIFEKIRDMPISINLD
jgi:hypothetical protein